jgi:cytochrome c551/c552
MKDCAVDAKLTSMMPDFARNAHGNLADQNRLVGAQRGINTAPAKPAETAAPQAKDAPSKKVAAAAVDAGQVQALMKKNNCVACHAIDRRVVGPSWSEIAGKHEGKPDYIAAKIRSGGSGVWGAIPMPPQTLDDAEARQIASWLAAGASN